MRTLVVLGGADGAITTLATAARLGLHTICVDARTDAPAVGYAAEFLNLSTRDVPAIAAALGDRGDLAGVVSPASDVNLPAQHRLARLLGLPDGLSPPALRASVDKGYFRALCDRLGQPGPRFVQDTAAAVRDRCGGLRYPVIVKPTDSSGGRGISLCDTPAALPAAVDAAAAYSATGIVIVEEFLDGAHFAAEAVVVGGEIALFGLGARTLTEPPHFVTLEHVMPAADPDLVARCRTALDEIVAALGYRWGSLNADLLVDRDGRVTVIELGARLGGNGSAELLGLVHGVDVTAAYVAMAVGEHPDLTPTRPACAAMHVLRATRPGKLVAVHGEDTARALPGLVDLILVVRPGDHVEPYHRAGAKLGYLLATAPDHDRLRATVAAVDTHLSFDIQPEDQP